MGRGCRTVAGGGPVSPTRMEFARSLIDWNDDGNVSDYGWWIMLYLRGRHRARWSSTKGTTRMWPHVSRGADENCNRSVTLHCWPIGHLDIWWETRWRTNVDGRCDSCRAEDAAYESGAA